MPDSGPHTFCALFKGSDPAQTYLCEGEGNVATGASHASPRAAGSSLLINPLNKLTLRTRLGTHWWGGRRWAHMHTFLPSLLPTRQIPPLPDSEWPGRGLGMFEMPAQGILGSRMHRKLGGG